MGKFRGQCKIMDSRDGLPLGNVRWEEESHDDKVLVFWHPGDSVQVYLLPVVLWCWGISYT